MILGWLDILWGCTDTCGCENFFNLLYPLQNSSVFLPITNLTKQFGVSMVVSRGKGATYCSGLFFPCLRVLHLADSNHAGVDKVY